MSHSDILLQALHSELSGAINDKGNRRTVSWQKCKQSVQPILSRMVAHRQLPPSPTYCGTDVLLLEKVSIMTRGYHCKICSLHQCSGHLAGCCQKTRPQFFPNKLFGLWILDTVSVDPLPFKYMLHKTEPYMSVGNFSLISNYVTSN